MKDYLNQLSNDLIGAAIEGHRDLGSGLLESTYELSLQLELKLRGLESRRQVALPIQYKDLVVPEAYRIDLVVEYLRMSDNHLGLLINFHTVRLTDGIKRLVHNFPS